MVKAEVRDGLLIPCITIGNDWSNMVETSLGLEDGYVFNVEQPHVLDNEEFNTLARIDGQLYVVRSIDLEFH